MFGTGFYFVVKLLKNRLFHAEQFPIIFMGH